MIDAHLLDLKELMIQPARFSSRISEKSLNTAYRHYVLMLIIFTLFFGVLIVTGGTISFTSYAQQFSTIPIIGSLITVFILNFSTLIFNWHILAVYLVFLHLLVGIFFIGFFFEIGVLLVGGNRGYVQTVKTLMYAATPALLLGWIPWLWVIGCFWSCALLVVGIEKTQQVSRINAVIIVLIPLVLLAILIILGENVIHTLSNLFNLVPIK